MESRRFNKKVTLIPNSKTFNVTVNIFNPTEVDIIITTTTIIFPFFIQLVAHIPNNIPAFTDHARTGWAQALTDWVFEPGNNFFTLYTSSLDIPYPNLPDGNYYLEVRHINTAFPSCNNAQTVYVRIENENIIEINYNYLLNNEKLYENIFSFVDRIEIIDEQKSSKFSDQLFMDVSFQIKDLINPEKQIYPKSWCNVMDFQTELTISEKNVSIISSNTYFNRLLLEDSKIPLDSNYIFSFQLENDSILTKFPDGLYFLNIIDTNKYLNNKSYSAHFNFENHTIYNVSYDKEYLTSSFKTSEDNFLSKFSNSSSQLTSISSIAIFLSLIIAIIVRRVKK